MTTFGVLAELDDEALRRWYAPPRPDWLRLNFVSTLDGAATGADGVSGSINNEADHRVFDMLRELCDAIVVGAGTIRTEGYAPNAKPMVVVSRSGDVPVTLRAGDLSQVHLATGASAPGLPEAGELLADRIMVLGEDEPALDRLRPALAERGHRHLLCEGGPSLATGLLAAGQVDELCCTLVPRLVGGDEPRIAHGPEVDVELRLHAVLEHDGTLLGRWLVG